MRADGRIDAATRSFRLEDQIMQRFAHAVRRACERRRLVRSIRRLEGELGERKVLEAVTGPSPGGTPERERVVPLRELERCAIALALKTTSGSVGQAAKLLGIGRATLYRRLAACKAPPDQLRSESCPPDAAD